MFILVYQSERRARVNRSNSHSHIQMWQSVSRRLISVVNLTADGKYFYKIGIDAKRYISEMNGITMNNDTLFPSSNAKHTNTHAQQLNTYNGWREAKRGSPKRHLSPIATLLPLIDCRNSLHRRLKIGHKRGENIGTQFMATVTSLPFQTRDVSVRFQNNNKICCAHYTIVVETMWTLTVHKKRPTTTKKKCSYSAHGVLYA